MPSGPCWIKFACHASRVQQVQQSVRILLAQDRFLGTVTNFSELEFDGFVLFADWDFPKQQTTKKLDKKEWS